jgi:hypothetical protein
MVVGLLRPDAGDRARFLSIRDVAEVGLISVGAGLLPSAIRGFGLSLASTWRISSALLSLAWVASAVVGVNRFRRAGILGDIPQFLGVAPLISLAGNALIWWNVVLAGDSAGSRYVLSALLLLAFAGLSFVAGAFHGRDDGPAA